MPKDINTILLLFAGEGGGGSRWFCAEKGSTEYKSIQKGVSKCTTKSKSMEPKMATHYSLQMYVM